MTHHSIIYFIILVFIELFIDLGKITLTHSYSFLYSKLGHPINLYFQTLTQIVMCFVSPFKIDKITHCQLNPTVKQKASRTQKSRGVSGLHKLETHHLSIT